MIPINSRDLGSLCVCSWGWDVVTGTLGQGLPVAKHWCSVSLICQFRFGF